MDFRGIKYYNKMQYKQSSKEREQSHYQALLNNREDFYGLKTRNALKQVAGKIMMLADDILKNRLKLVIKREKYFFLSTIFIVLAISSVLSLLVISLSRGNVSVGLALATLLLLPNLYSSMEQFAYLLTLLGENVGILNK